MSMARARLQTEKVVENVLLLFKGESWSWGTGRYGFLGQRWSCDQCCWLGENAFASGFALGLWFVQSDDVQNRSCFEMPRHDWHKASGLITCSLTTRLTSYLLRQPRVGAVWQRSYV